jgi:hypothetical protein
VDLRAAAIVRLERSLAHICLRCLILCRPALRFESVHGRP